MKNTNTQKSVTKAFTLISTLTTALFSNLAIADEELAMLDANDRWQMNRLFQPTPKQLERETNGKIVIYDGLRDITVEKALDENFNRIENMMFARVVVTDDEGQPEVDINGNVKTEEDGCD